MPATNTEYSVASLALLPHGHYALMEHFYTLQGEGAYAGQAAYFIRLAGCDVGCHWCDVKESWDASQHPVVQVVDLVAWVVASGAPRVVITGGEPLLHNLDALTSALHAAGLAIHIETSGTQPLTGQLDWITFSPKKFKAPLPEWYDLAHELKVIVHHRHDLQWAQDHADKMNPTALLYLQPEWHTPASMHWIVDHIQAHPHWRLSLQTHKYLNIP